MMRGVHQDGTRLMVSAIAYRRIVALTLASLVFIMVTGAAVRLTESGLGCSTWPSCESDSFTPRPASGSAGMVEFGNRLVTGAVGLMTLAAVVGARRRRPYRDDLYRWSLGLPAWVFANALVGALVVWLHLSPVSVIGHFLLSLGAVWNAVVLHHKAGEVPAPGDTGERRHLAVPAVRRACNYLLGAAALTLVTGTLVTGSGPHAGDERADRLPFALGEVVRLHGLSAVLFLSLTLVVLWMARHGDAAAPVERRLRILLVVLVAQAGVGYAQYFTGVPAWLVAIHVLGAATVWIAVLQLQLSLTEPVTPAANAPPATPASGVEAQVGDDEPSGPLDAPTPSPVGGGASPR
jgi:cytochrome c oxidase assembly protein subunit 15